MKYKQNYRWGIGIILIVIACSFVSGCSTLVLQERERELDEEFAKGKISKIQYLSLKNDLKQKEDEIESRQKITNNPNGGAK